MHLALSATGVDTAIPLFRVEVDGNGRWSYESRGVEHAGGTLTEGDRVQLKTLYDDVNWQLEVLNAPVSADDRKLFKLEVDDGHGHKALYQFSEAMNHRSYEFRDLVHFLRHNVATGGDLVGRTSDEPRQQPPATQ